MLAFIVVRCAVILENVVEAQWLSGRVLVSRPRESGSVPHRRRGCVLEQDTLILAQYCNPGRPIPTLLKKC